MSKSRSTAVLVGRTNVGKSTIFNRLLESGEVLVSSTAGTTRDAALGQVTWRGQNYWLIDTAGADVNISDHDDINISSLKQLESATKNASVILLVADAKVGLVPADLEMAKKLRRLKKPIILVLNKADNPKIRHQVEEINLGFKDTVIVSARNGSGLGDLLDLMLKYLHPAEVEPKVSIGIIGRTNVGKSSLFNQLLKKERSIVSPQPHTTRDRQRDYLLNQNVTIELIDTAGIRRQIKKASELEQQGAYITQKTLKDLSAVILVIDGSAALSWQDQALAAMAAESNKPCLIVANKLDVINEDNIYKINKHIRAYLGNLSWAPIIYTSAITGQNCAKIIPQINQQIINFNKELTAQEISNLSKYFKRATATKDLPLGAFTQTGTAPPSFVLKINTKENLPSALGKWVAGVIRQNFDFSGTPLRAHVEGRTKLHHKHAD